MWMHEFHVVAESKWARVAVALGKFSARIEKCRFARDSPLEQSGFEPLVPFRAAAAPNRTGGH
jgi:hypothetical protein